MTLASPPGATDLAGATPSSRERDLAWRRAAERDQCLSWFRHLGSAIAERTASHEAGPATFGGQQSRTAPMSREAPVRAGGGPREVGAPGLDAPSPGGASAWSAKCSLPAARHPRDTAETAGAAGAGDADRSRPPAPEDARARSSSPASPVLEARVGDGAPLRRGEWGTEIASAARAVRPEPSLVLGAVAVAHPPASTSAPPRIDLVVGRPSAASAPALAELPCVAGPSTEADGAEGEPGPRRASAAADPRERLVRALAGGGGPPAPEHVRWHVDVSEAGVRVWVGVDPSQVASVEAWIVPFVERLRRGLGAQGTALLAVVCNGREVTEHAPRADDGAAAHEETTWQSPR